MIKSLQWFGIKFKLIRMYKTIPDVVVFPYHSSLIS